MQHHLFDNILSDNGPEYQAFRGKSARTQARIEDWTRGDDRQKSNRREKSDQEDLNKTFQKNIYLIFYLVFLFLQPSGSLDQEEQDKNSEQTL